MIGLGIGIFMLGAEFIYQRRLSQTTAYYQQHIEDWFTEN
jgi:hypothetical protein